MSFTLLTFPNNFRAWKAQIAARYAGVDIDVPESFEYGKDNLKPEFKAISPLGKVPVLVTPQGAINQPDAILRYVARLRADSGLYGNSFYESGQVDQWLAFCDTEIEPARNMWIYPIQGSLEFDGKAYAEAKKILSEAFTVLNDYLLSNTFLVGNQVTIADIAIACTIADLWTKVLVPAFTKRWGNLTRWFNTVVNQQNFLEVTGELKQATKEQQAPKPAAAPKAEKPKPEAKPAEPKPAAAAAPKPAAPKEDDLEALAEAEAAAAKKRPNPLDALPPSPMVLDAVKKLLWSKKPYNPNFFSTFWGPVPADAEDPAAAAATVFDPAGYSFFQATYKHNDENTVEFRTGNLVGGWLQRLDPLRKYAMGVVVITTAEADKPPFNVSSLWMFRGQEVPEEMTSCDDYALQNWTKLDTADNAARAQIENYFRAADDDSRVGGQICTDARYFK